VNCHIDAEGRIKFLKERGSIDTGKALTFWRGASYAGSKVRPWYTVESDEHTFKFRNFDFTRKSLEFSLERYEEEETAMMEDSFFGEGSDIAKIEFQTHAVEVGSIIRLRHYKQFVDSELVDSEEFPHHWKPIPPPPPGMPDHNVLETKTRPVDNQWLETKTIYGYLKVTISPMLKGAIEFEFKTPDAQNESSVVLEEYDGTIKGGGRIQIAIVRGRLMHSRGWDGFKDFDEPIAAVNDRIYRVKIAWDGTNQTYRAWIDGVPQKYKGSYDIPIIYPGLRRGIDTICLHCGSFMRAGLGGGRVQPVLTYWRGFRVTIANDINI
jgi:hypothetical protein